jgi:hypothetical protein
MMAPFIGVSASLLGVLICAAVCPHPPSLISEIAGDEPRQDVVDLRSQCLAAIDAVHAASPELLCIVASGTVTGPVTAAALGDFEPLAVGRWLVSQRDWTASWQAVTVAANAEATECSRLGAELAARADRVALLVMSEGSQRGFVDRPRPFDPRAEHSDATVVDRLRSGESAGLLELGQAGSKGLNPLRVLAGAAGDSSYDTEIFYDAAPFGVGYYVAVWEHHG